MLARVNSAVLSSLRFSIIQHLLSASFAIAYVCPSLVSVRAETLASVLAPLVLAAVRLLHTEAVLAESWKLPSDLIHIA